MSGIVCLFYRDGQGVTGDDLAAMSETLSHRGPDGSSAWCGGSAGLGHQRLETTPESVYDDQPTGRNGQVIAADARVDNRAELLERLPFADPPERIPDSRILLSAYRKWGRDCVDHLVGAYSFVVWDSERRRAFCARDHFGVKPLYYHLDETRFAVASEPKALLALPEVPRDIDPESVGDFLMHNFEGKERSSFEAVNRLPPANTMSVGTDEATTRRYWDLDPARTVTCASDAAYERRFRELFEQAVECRLRTNGTVGSDLSGGLDSTAVTVVTQNLLPNGEPLHTFSNVFDETPACDEREFFETVLEREDVTPHRIPVNGTGVLVDSDRMLQHFDHPPYNTMHFAKWERLKQLDQADVAVHLSGEMGDSAVGFGFGLLPQLLRRGRLIRLRNELRELGEVMGAPTRRLFLENAVTPLVPSRIRRLRRKLRGDETPAEASNPTLDPEFVDRHGLLERYRSLQRGGGGFTDTARERQYRSLMSGRITATLETIDMMHAPFGVEPRHPFTDKRLVEFSLAIPPSQQLSDGYTRSILRRSLDDHLPAKIQWRPWKAMLGGALGTALSCDEDALRRLVENPAPVTNYVDEAALRRSYERFSDGSGNSSDVRALWKALMLSAWIQERGLQDDSN